MRRGGDRKERLEGEKIAASRREVLERELVRFQIKLTFI